MKFLELMEAMRAEGCIASLRLGPWGWSFDVMDPNLPGINMRGFETPDAAVQAVHAKWEIAHGALNPGRA